MDVPESDRERIFDRLSRLDDGRTRDAGCLGIGLAQVARIAESHSGSVRCTSSTGGGARYEFIVPADDPSQVKRRPRLPITPVYRGGCVMFTIQVIPNLSSHMPKTSPHICFSSGIVMVAPADSLSQ